MWNANHECLQHTETHLDVCVVVFFFQIYNVKMNISFINDRNSARELMRGGACTWWEEHPLTWCALVYSDHEHLMIYYMEILLIFSLSFLNFFSNFNVSVHSSIFSRTTHTHIYKIYKKIYKMLENLHTVGGACFIYIIVFILFSF